MIKAYFFRNEKNQITGFKISGHAMYAQFGEDIICSAVSALSITTINSLSEQLGLKDHYSVDEDTGFLECRLPADIDLEGLEKAQYILKTLEIGLISIADAYKENLKLF